MFRLEALGDPAYLEIDSARQLYESGKSVRVISAEDPISWFLLVAPKRYRFTITFYAPSGTPLRTATWEQDSGRLLCRRTIDLFYPDGDPGWAVPISEVVSVTQQISADGVVEVTLSSPIDDDEYREATGVQLADFQMAVPKFGEWQPLLDASKPVQLERFGLDSIDAAIAYADQRADQGGESEAGSSRESSGWRLQAADRDIMHAVDEIVDGADTVDGFPVLRRGSARIVPLSVQAPPVTGGRDPHEERRRMAVLADQIRDACEQREGRAIAFDLDHRGVDIIASYAAALRMAGATSAQWWEYGQRHGVVLVWSGGAATGNLSLALHVLPVSWVSERQTEPARDGIDVAWSLADVAGTHGTSESMPARP